MRSSVRYGRVDSMETMLAFLEKIGNYLMLVRLTDILDVAIIAFLVYKLLDLVKSTRAENILKGVVMFLLALWLAEIFHLNGIAWNTGVTLLMLMFAAVTLGGLGTANGALVGALIVGIVADMSTLVIPSDMRYASALAILILVLLIRPQGIFGKQKRVG